MGVKTVGVLGTVSCIAASLCIRYEWREGVLVFGVAAFGFFFRWLHLLGEEPK
jgi:hypothetical protein